MYLEFQVPVHIKKLLLFTKNQNVAPRTIYRRIVDCEQSIPCLNQPQNGKLRMFTKARAGNLARRWMELARESGAFKDTVSKELSKIQKKNKMPKHTANQLSQIPRCCRALKGMLFANSRVISMDCPDNVKCKQKTKCSDKILVWCPSSIGGICGAGSRARKTG